MQHELGAAQYVPLEDLHDQGVVQRGHLGQRLLLRCEQHCQDAPGGRADNNVEHLAITKVVQYNNNTAVTSVKVNFNNNNDDNSDKHCKNAGGLGRESEMNKKIFINKIKK